MKSLVVALLGLFTLGFSASHAEAFELSLVGAGDLAKPAIDYNGSSESVTSKLTLGGGVLVGFGLNMVTELEFGVLHMGRDYTYPVASGTGEDSYSRYEIPVILRLYLFKYVTVGAGGYYAVPIGQSTYTQTPTGGSGTSTSSTANSNFKNDFGAVGSASIKIPINVATDLVLDGRYLYGLVNTTKTAGETFKSRDVEILLGFAFGF